MSLRSAASCALAFALLAPCDLAAPVPAAAASAASGAERAARTLTGLDLIELQIVYTTLLARYYRPIAPRTLVDGARTGLLAELYARGLADAQLPFTPPHVGFGDGGDLIDGMVLRSLARYAARLDAHRLVAAAAAGELAALHDPYSVMFAPQQYAKFDAYLHNTEFGGIGAILTYEAPLRQARVERVVPDSAAARGGLRAGDAIVAIDGTSVAGLDAGGVLRALRGRVGSSVRVDVRRVGTVTAYTFVRAALRDPQVETRRFDTVGYVRLLRFGDRAGRDVRAALGALREQGATAFVLDLRGNGGGYGDEATAVASLFVASGPIFVTRERGAAPVAAQASGGVALHAPLAVLVDHDTASAAEIVAGAVQDGGAGTILGARTYGKGLVQSIFPLPDGSALKLTTARYTTPRGRDIDRIGIAPDVPVAEPPGSQLGNPERDPQLTAGLAIVRAAR